MERINCCLCTATTLTEVDMERHILTSHPDIYEVVTEDHPVGIADPDSPYRIEKKALEAQKKDDPPYPIRTIKTEAPENMAAKDEFKTDDDLMESEEDSESEVWKKLELVIVEGEKCSECNFIASDATLLDDHKLKMHQQKEFNNLTLRFNDDKSLNETKQKCPKCKLSFQSTYCLEKHLQKVHVEQVCNRCDKTFPDLKQLKSHFENEHHENRFQCLKCDRSFKRSNNLKRHELTNHKRGDKRSLQSKFCGETIPDEDNHSESKDQGEISNSLDGERSSSSLLNRQQQSSHKAKTCFLCKISFIDLGEYIRHFTKFHRKKYNCPACEATFGKKILLKTHQKKYHDPNANVSPCIPCNKSFTDLYTQLKHNREMHSKNNFHCQNCPKSFSRQYHLKRHLIKCKINEDV